MLEIDNFFISGLILPLEESIDKEKGVRCNGFGRIESWVISGYEEGSPVMWVSTGLAYYDCIKPSYKYRRFYNLFFGKAHACVEVYRKLSRTYGGNSNIGVDELIAGGEFIHNQLIGLDATAKKNDKMFTGLPVLVALREEKKKFESFLTSEAATSGIVGNTSLKVVEESADQSTSTTCVTEEDEDMKLARLLQEEENWLSMKQNNRQSSVPPSKFYIKINENEIANDYPLHTYYKTSFEEIDEFLALCNDGSNELPENMLHNWTLYNSDVYYSEYLMTVPIVAIQGKCEVRKKHDLPPLYSPAIFEHIIFCEHLFKEKMIDDFTYQKKKSKFKEGENGFNNIDKLSKALSKNRLATLDIFAGCGGLSKGLESAGMSVTKCAIEYEERAGEAFKSNHPEALVFINNCNMILRAIMSACGDADDCICTSEASELAAKLDEKEINSLPRPGEVEFICGGPPCQGFSGMNRFNHGSWSKVQCEMILAFLSFADYFRPKFFLLENVRSFVSFNKGQTFRLTLASLLEMGYQVRFGVLEAGAYGVSQFRKRAFIWAASPEEMLPEWPEPMHVFAGSELRVTLSGNSQYAAVKSTANGAPFRAITVKDTIGDLPSIGNGALVTTMKVKLSTGQVVDLVPWCLPNTAKRHNQWKGLFGRLDWEGNFPTSVTDPQPMGKVGMCFHPEQDRIVTVRECARSQGFPDNYKFVGNIHHKHRQIGNAVPPPLAIVLGRKLKEAIEK
ncbi:hypothetical protein P3X46_013390 [Hevea brasiliensis]|uniref:Cytosine-specific methyltransferase n=1 Tax=Hevea brasiliensis TaxID=3981 RepID=A0ABQ9M5R8_HEVBR|nr:hypothetical protein P3X46_013390 [Hevea brasiliensis]